MASGLGAYWGRCWTGWPQLRARTLSSLVAAGFVFVFLLSCLVTVMTSIDVRFLFLVCSFFSLSSLEKCCAYMVSLSRIPGSLLFVFPAVMLIKLQVSL